MQHYERILVFGDSIACGAGDAKYGGFVNQLHCWIGSEFPNIATINVSIPCDSTRELVKRLENELSARINIPLKIIFEIGTNDCWTNHDGTQNVDEEDFEKNLETIIALTQKFSIPFQDILFLEIFPFDETKTMNIPWAKISYSNTFRKKYNEILEKITKSYRISLVKVHDFVPEEDTNDGLHPNEKGTQKIFFALKTILNF